MNKNIAKYLLSLAVVALAGGGCEVNDFNDGLDGFEGRPLPGDTQTIALTLSAADYSAIASNKDNIAIAKELGVDAEEELKSIGDNKFISAQYSQTFLPAFLSKDYSYLDNGSAIQLSYVHKTMGSNILEKSLSGQYALADADYNTVWGADQTTPFFTPEKPAAEFLPAILKAKKTGATAGDHSLVTYMFSYTEPVVTASARALSAPETRADVAVKKISDINFSGKENATAEGIVIGLHAQGVLFQDDSGIALFYNGAETFFSLGDKIRVSGNTQLRYGVNQFDKGGKAEYLSHPAAEFAYPAIAAEITKDNIQTFSTAAAHVSITGTLKVDGTYVNLELDGMDPTVFRGSLSYVFPSMDMAGLNGKTISATGYYLGNSGSSTKNFTLMVTSVKEVGGTDVTATGSAATKAGTYTCQGYVAATYDKGFMLNDGTGNIVVYQNKTSTVEVGALVTVAGETEIRYEMGQFKSSAVVTDTGKTGKVTHAPAMELNKETIEAYMDAPIYRYTTTTAKLTKKVDGSKIFYELHDFEGTTIYGSLSYPLTAQKALLDKLVNKQVIVSGYLIGANTSPGYFSIMALNIEPKDKYVTETRYDVYTYTGSAWEAVAAKNALAVNEADYKEMGLPNTYFDKSNSTDKYVVSFLNKKYPYAQADQTVTLFYNYKEKEGDPYAMGGVYKFDGSAWSQNLMTEQYVKSEGKWKFDPSVVITLIPDYKVATPEMKAFFQLGSDYVWEKIDTPLGIVEKGKGYVSKYGTNEVYSGTSAYNINVDLRVDAARTQYAAGYEGMTDAEVTALMTKRLCREVFPAMLNKQYPDAQPIPGVEVTYTINFGIYTGDKLTDCTHTAVFKVVNTGIFEFVSLKVIGGDPIVVED